MGENVRLGIIANQGKGLRERLEAHGIADYFELNVSSAEVGMKKPSPNIFATSERCGKKLRLYW